MRLSAPIYTLKRQARDLARAEGLALHKALDRLARKEGFRSWSHLAACWSEHSPARTLMTRIAPGTMTLLAARPGQGKTLMGLELAVTTAQTEQESHFMTLDYTEADVLGLLQDLGLRPADVGPRFHLDTSDGITAAYILSKARDGALVVVDYLQLLDQDRRTPPLVDQLEELRAGTAKSGVSVVLISQIDRRFDLSARGMPALEDVRLPNPVDLNLFDTACFLHEGNVKLAGVA